jgi:branched-chain amino acid aminotransferase
MTTFGTVFIPEMSISWFDGNQWSGSEIVPCDSLHLHPGAHVLHYSSTCFEGLKAFRHVDGSINIFRMDKNIDRFAHSSELLALPTLDKTITSNMILDIVRRYADDVPQTPGSMYIRPTHIGTEPAIGKAAAPSLTSCLYVLLSPVGDYFSGGNPTLKVLLEEDLMRCAPHMGMIKSGGNYASALGPTLQAKKELGVDQVLFCPNGDVQETGAANFLLIDGDTIVTKALDATFLHGVTRDSVLTLARDMGMTVEERQLTIDELLDRISRPGCEAALSGTAAVLTSVGTLVRGGREFTVGNGQPGPVTAKLRTALNDIQWGKREDRFGWLTAI